jgi:hypothetical protein
VTALFDQRRLTRRASATVVGGLAVAVFLYFGSKDGGYAPETWLPGTLVVLALLVAVGTAPVGRRLLTRRPTLVAGAALAAYTAWSYASISWAQVKGDAWDGANRTLLYLCVFLLFSVLPLGTRQRLLLLTVYVLGVGVLGAVDFIRAVDAGHGHGFVLGRLATPITYPNADAALFLAAATVALVLAMRRELPVVVRALLLGDIALLAELALLTQTRGSLVAAPLAVAVVLALGPGRLRMLLALGLVAVPFALATDRLLAVYDVVVSGNRVHATLVDAEWTIAVSVAVTVAVGLAVAAIDRRVIVPASVSAAVARAVVALGALAVVVAAVSVAAIGIPRERLATMWRDFKTNPPVPTQTMHLESGLASGRYDVWRIALDQFRRHPLTGVGSDNYLVDYLRDRRTADTSRYPESTPLRALSETGLVGGLLFFAFAIVAIRAAVRRCRRRQALPSAASTAAFGMFAYWAIHGSIDWFWELPALAAPALAALALAAASPIPAAVASRARSRTWRPLAVAGVTAALALPAGAAVAAPWISLRQIHRATSVWSSDPTEAFRLLRQARRWNPLSEEADLTAATLHSELGDRAAERRDLLRALRRNEHDWYAYMMLGVVDSLEGRRTLALQELTHARRMTPLDYVLFFVRLKVRTYRPLTEAQVREHYQAQARENGLVQK